LQTDNSRGGLYKCRPMTVVSSHDLIPKEFRKWHPRFFVRENLKGSS
jgi:hypothetical protein